MPRTSRLVLLVLAVVLGASLVVALSCLALFLRLQSSVVSASDDVHAHLAATGHGGANNHAPARRYTRAPPLAASDNVSQPPAVYSDEFAQRQLRRRRAFREINEKKKKQRAARRNDDDAWDEPPPTPAPTFHVDAPPAHVHRAASGDAERVVPVSLCADIHAFYYPWYGSESVDGKWVHWNHPYLPHWEAEVTARYPKGRHKPPMDLGATFFPSLGAYSSRANATVDAHMLQLQRAGAGVLVVSWYPPGLADENGVPSDGLVPHLLDACARHGLKLAFHSEPYKDRTPRTLRRDIEYIHKTYGPHPALYRAGVNRLPVVYVYDPYHVEFSEWAKLLDPDRSRKAHQSGRGDAVQSIRGTEYDVVAVALLLKPDDVAYLSTSGFDGGYSYFASKTFTFASDWTNWKQLAHEAHQLGKFFVPSVGPGYDDTQVRPWNVENVHHRGAGKYYNASFAAALAALATTKPRGAVRDEARNPAWVSITSFNEWHEGTQIEMASTARRSVHSTFAQFQYGRYDVPHHWRAPYPAMEALTSAHNEHDPNFDSGLYLDLTRYWAFHSTDSVCDDRVTPVPPTVAPTAERPQAAGPGDVVDDEAEPLGV